MKQFGDQLQRVELREIRRMNGSKLRARRRHVANIGVAILLAACGSSLPEPEFSAQPSDAFHAVGFPPPPGRVEAVPPKPRSGAVWIDGEWQWDGSGWAWEYGRWVMPPRGATYSRWEVERAGDGALLFAAGVWRNEKHQQIRSPEPLAVARARDESVVNPEGEQEPTDPNVAPEGAPAKR